MRHREVAREILEHRRFAGVDVVQLEKAVVGPWCGFRLELGRDDVEHVLEVPVEAEPRQHRIGVAAGAVGEDELAAGELLDRDAERRIGLERGVVDLVHEIEEIVGLHAVLDHQSAHRGAVALVVVLLHAEGLLVGDLEEAGDVVANALVHLLPEIEVMGIERVVEVEHPGLDVAEGARRGRNGRVHGVCAPDPGMLP